VPWRGVLKGKNDMNVRLFAIFAFSACLLTVTACDVQKSHGPLVPAETLVPAAITPSSLCTSTDPAAILLCERAKYDHMDPDQLAEFLKASAASLNRNEIAGGPYGLLRKPTGSQCAGYSCDIICAGQGTAQRQHDVLLDAEGAQQVTWSEAETYPHIRVDECVIQ
jgi:hypothetical protein